MKNEKLLQAIGKIDDELVYGAVNDTKERKKKNTWVKWSAMAACMCLIVGSIAMISHFDKEQNDPQLGEIVLSDRTTAKVSYGCDDMTSTKAELVYLTEGEMFKQDNLLVFRGKVSGLANVTIDFNGIKEARCIATIVIDKVYQGNISADEQITMLIPCAIDQTGISKVEDTNVISQLKSGMEGIFMPVVYDDSSYIEMNGAVLMKQDLAACGLADGMRWAFLSTDQGVLFESNAYPGAENATNLDDIEAYVIEMLK
jgi:hypothetical protein